MPSKMIGWYPAVIFQPYFLHRIRIYEESGASRILKSDQQKSDEKKIWRGDLRGGILGSMDFEM